MLSGGIIAAYDALKGRVGGAGVGLMARSPPGFESGAVWGCLGREYEGVVRVQWQRRKRRSVSLVSGSRYGA
jgi:hypothetical protein